MFSWVYKIQKRKNAVSTIKRVIYPNQYSKFGITEDFFKNTLIYEAFEHYNSYKSCDKITGKYKENEFLLSELCLRYIESYYSGVRPRLKYDIETIFDGIFIKTRIFNTINSRVYIEPKNYWDTSKNNEEYSEIAFDELNKNKFYFNSANIKAEFENNFKVYEMREENGAEILNESFIEEILKLKEKYNKDIFICISDNIANIMINNMKVFDEKIFVEEGLNTENILKSVNIVEEIIDIVKNFDIIEKQ